MRRSIVFLFLFVASVQAVESSGYWGIQITLSGAAQQIYTLAHAIDATFPTKAVRLSLQSDCSNTTATTISVGDSNVSASRKSYMLQPCGTAFYQTPNYITDITKIYALGSATNFLLNVEASN